MIKDDYRVGFNKSGSYTSFQWQRIVLRTVVTVAMCYCHVVIKRYLLTYLLTYLLRNRRRDTNIDGLCHCTLTCLRRQMPNWQSSCHAMLHQTATYVWHKDNGKTQIANHCEWSYYLTVYHSVSSTLNIYGLPLCIRIPVIRSTYTSLMFWALDTDLTYRTEKCKSIANV